MRSGSRSWPALRSRRRGRARPNAAGSTLPLVKRAAGFGLLASWSHRSRRNVGPRRARSRPVRCSYARFGARSPQSSQGALWTGFRCGDTGNLRQGGGTHSCDVSISVLSVVVASAARRWPVGTAAAARTQHYGVSRTARKSVACARAGGKHDRVRPDAQAAVAQLIASGRLLDEMPADGSCSRSSVFGRLGGVLPWPLPSAEAADSRGDGAVTAHCERVRMWDRAAIYAGAAPERPC